MQVLDEYLSDILVTHNTPTPLKLRVSSRALIDIFNQMISQSEREVKEYGLNLFWQLDSVMPGDIIPGLGKTAVDMKTSTFKDHHEYIGDCHTHPYLRKMGPGVDVGPSSSDYMEWWSNPPSNFNVALHFVLSGETVFLILTRDITSMGVTLLGNVQGGVTPDTPIINEPMYDINVAEAYGKAQTEGKEVEFWKKRYPTLPKEFADANIVMNCQLAQALNFEYYLGKFKTSGIILDRVSTNEVYAPQAYGTVLTPPQNATWISDNKRNRCVSCKRSFTVTFRKHHCRRCGEIFCHECSSRTAPVTNRLSRWGGHIVGVKVARVCDKCYAG